MKSQSKINLENIRAALIDMDGVLYDSMPFHARAWYQMFEEIGIQGDPDEFYLYEGMTGGDTVNLLFQRELGRNATDEEIRRLYARKAEIFTDSGEKRMMPGAADMLTAFREAGIITVLVTGSAQGSLLNSLDRDYPGAFPAHRRVTALDVVKGKPDPEPYLKGLEKAGVKKEETIIVENAPLGVRAGKAAGCFTIAVTTGPIPRSAFEKEGADMIFPDMTTFAAWLKENLKAGLGKKIDSVVSDVNPDKVLIVTDTNVNDVVLPKIKDSIVLNESPVVVIRPGEEGKNIKSVMQVWEALEDCGATRKSLVINIGGGMVTDLGGFAAATFKRGIRTINLPTTLLGAVDAATGGKTGINFKGLKNEIGAFHMPVSVIISSFPYESLSHKEKMSGYAEMVKTALFTDPKFYKELLDVSEIINDPERLENAVKRCVEIKDEVVAQDPTEKGFRKVLNLGHTAGHAIESLSFRNDLPVPHGFAVAYGMYVELYLSHLVLGFPIEEVDRYLHEYLQPNYPSIDLKESDIELLFKFMAHDKKNQREGVPNFTLLKNIGEPVIDCEPTKDQIIKALLKLLKVINLF